MADATEDGAPTGAVGHAGGVEAHKSGMENSRLLWVNPKSFSLTCWPQKWKAAAKGDLGL